MSIRPLPTHVAEKIRSSILITSLNDVVSGLVKNSLDADATSVNVSVDYARATCLVEDNGVGIPPQEFRLDGGLGKPHRMCSCFLVLFWIVRRLTRDIMQIPRSCTVKLNAMARMVTPWLPWLLCHS